MMRLRGVWFCVSVYVAASNLNKHLSVGLSGACSVSSLELQSAGSR